MENKKIVSLNQKIRVQKVLVFDIVGKNAAIKLEAPPKPKQEEDIIKESGLLEAYELFLRAVCKHGLPEGNVYEFAAQQI